MPDSLVPSLLDWAWEAVWTGMGWSSRDRQGSRPSLCSWGLSPGWGEEEGAAGVPGEVTPLPHICVHGPSELHTCEANTDAHPHVHSDIRACKYANTDMHNRVCAHV